MRVSSTCGKGKARLAMFEDSTLDLKVLTAADSFMKAYPTNKAVNLQFEQKITYDARALASQKAQAGKSKREIPATSVNSPCATPAASTIPAPSTTGAVGAPTHRSDKLLLSTRRV